ncbi:MAG: hypothetical protein DRR19_24425 [Candidatus Parabeggiatoa sp. nov. 1]|nr:MAG: hypothetical protein DRR19_24425 [Gammaproteobacteria bacterium]
MSHQIPPLERIALKGLEIAPSQVRLVPLLRRDSPGDLRLSRRSYDDDMTVVALDGKRPLEQPRTVYSSYIPHALVASWSNDGTPVAAFGCQMTRYDGKQIKAGPVTVRIAHRMARREAPNRLRFLPLHLSMEGFLALHFGGPDIAWEEYSHDTLAYGLGSRAESSYSGDMIAGLADALRVFEIHQQQVGVLVFVADALASAFVVSHPEDYRALHQSLIEDFYGELMYYYGYLYPNPNRMETYIDDKKVASLADMRQALAKMRSDWAQFQAVMAEAILEREVLSQNIYRLGPFQLQRFMTQLKQRSGNHIGEAIVREDGTLEYLKTYRLSEAQRHRAYLLSQLAAHNWNIRATAEGLQQTYGEFILRMGKAGFDYLLKEHVLRAARQYNQLPR